MFTQSKAFPPYNLCVVLMLTRFRKTRSSFCLPSMQLASVFRA